MLPFKQALSVTLEAQLLNTAAVQVGADAYVRCRLMYCVLKKVNH
jgi:hypothetical protein